MHDSLIALLFLAVGLALLVAELFIPSGGVILALAVFSIGGSVWYAWKAWGGSSPQTFWTYVVTVMVLIPAAVIAALAIVPRTRMGRHILLEAPSPEEVAPYTEDQQHLAAMVGRRGRALTLMSPGGLVLVDGERLHCESEGMLIEPETHVEVVAVKGNRLVVREVPADQSSQETPDSEETGGSPLDFDLPQD